MNVSVFINTKQMVLGDCVYVPEQRHEFPKSISKKFRSPCFNAISRNLAFEIDIQNTKMSTITTFATPDKVKVSVGCCGRLASGYHHFAVDFFNVTHF